MGLITASGLAQVSDNLTAAKAAYEKAAKAERDAKRRLETAQVQYDCPHENLVTDGHYIHIVTTCEDCGFTWYD